MTLQQKLAMETEADSQKPRLDAGRAEAGIGYKLRMAQILAFRAFEEQLTGFGRAPRYLGLLSVILEHPGQTQSRIAEAVALRRSSLVKILDQLEQDGLLTRRASANDRRSNGVWLTDQGKETVKTLLREAEAEERRILSGMSEEQVACLHSGLSQLITNLSTGAKNE